jgi:4-diphosphocytidyl-2C-methyl-D-erythritol kinase
LKTPFREEVLDLRSLVLAGLRDPRILVQDLRNDFEPAVCAAHPAVLSVKEEMTRRGAVYASMSGSGSSVYGFFVHHNDAVEAARKLQLAGYRTFLTPPHFSPP